MSILRSSLGLGDDLPSGFKLLLCIAFGEELFDAIAEAWCIFDFSDAPLGVAQTRLRVGQGPLGVCRDLTIEVALYFDEPLSFANKLLHRGQRIIGL